MTLGLLILSASLLAAQGAATKAIKDDKGACQVLVPADWKVGTMLTSSARDPKDTLYIQVMWEQDYKVAPFNELDMKIRKIEKMFENTAQRVFYQTKGMKIGPTPPSTIWTLYTPAAQKGACHCNLTLKPGASEQAAKDIIMTLGPAK